MNLNDDVIIEILLHSDINSVRSLCKTNKRFNHVCNNYNILKMKFSRDLDKDLLLILSPEYTFSNYITISRSYQNPKVLDKLIVNKVKNVLLSKSFPSVLCQDISTLLAHYIYKIRIDGSPLDYVQYVLSDKIVNALLTSSNLSTIQKIQKHLSIVLRK